ncbi:MAG: peptide ABC transporter ATP-binding protein, partial [Oscillospiraceae bacterium]|nr:peptide ABC transporter ATP-binding protein [Oscillospiraceae bacterium]
FISDRIGVIYKGVIVEVAETTELFNFPLHPYTHSLISAIPIPDPQLEKHKVLYTYDPSIHDYSEDKPELVDIGHGHWIYGNKKEIEEYKAIREKGEPLKSITITDDMDEINKKIEESEELHGANYILERPLHDTGNLWLGVLSFILSILGLIGAGIFRRLNYIRNFKVCRKGALAGLAVKFGIVLIYLICLFIATR